MHVYNIVFLLTPVSVHDNVNTQAKPGIQAKPGVRQ